MSQHKVFRKRNQKPDPYSAPILACEVYAKRATLNGHQAIATILNQAANELRKLKEQAHERMA